MNFIKRAFWSIKTRIGKTVLILSIFVIICNLVLAGLSIQRAQEKAGDSARKKLGAEVNISVDWDNPNYSGGINPDQYDMNDFVLTEDKLKDLIKNKLLKGYNYMPSTAGKTENIKAVNDTKKNNNEGNMSAAHWPNGMTPNVNLQGIITTELDKDFQRGDNKIIKGRGLTERDDNKHVIVIEKKLADLNKLSLGDKVDVKGTNDKVLSLEIVGIYQTKKRIDNIPEEQLAPDLVPSNLIYMPYKTLFNLAASFDGSSKSDVKKAVFYLKDPKDVNAFKKEVKKSSINFDVFKADADDVQYKKMVGPLENVGSLSNTIVYIVIVAGAVILGLIIALSIRERRYEMGVLISIGESKGKLIGQFLAEMLIIAIMAIGISSVTGNVIGQKAGDYLLDTAVTTAQKEADTGPTHYNLTNQNKDVKTVDKIDVNISSADIGKLSIISLLITIFATMIPSLAVLRLKPKDILTKHD